MLVAKLSLGALALNDIWFGGQTMNPWLLEEGASGSSAGPGAATAAGLVAFSIGSETGGSIVAPAMRCGVTGLRPTFGRVPRTGAMTLCWSLDKLGPMTRSRRRRDARAAGDHRPGRGRRVERAEPSRLRCGRAGGGLRVGYFAGVDEGEPGDRRRSRARWRRSKKLGMVPAEVTLPDWPYGSLMPILFAEGRGVVRGAGAQRSGSTQLKVQVPDAWPNLFRQARFLSAVDFVQADRLRRKVAMEMARIFSEVDLLLVPSLRDEKLTITNFTGHPSLTLRAGFVEVSRGAQRLGAGSGESAAEVLAAAPRAARRDDASAGCSTKEPSRASVWRSSARRRSGTNGQVDSENAFSIQKFQLLFAGAP